MAATLKWLKTDEEGKKWGQMEGANIVVLLADS